MVFQSRAYLVAQALVISQALKQRQYTHAMRRDGQLVGPSLELGLDVDAAELGTEGEDATRVLDVVERLVRLDSLEKDRRKVAVLVLVAEL